MGNAQQALAGRIRELRRRQFGPRGKREFAQRVGVSLEEYERFERGTLPPGEIMVRMCEVTGEDLQWLLTGVAGRGTVVISGTRARHQDLLTRLAKLLDDKPSLATPVEAFVDLLLRGEQTEGQMVPQLPATPPRDLIPIFEAAELPARLPESGAPQLVAGFPLSLSLPSVIVTQREPAGLAEPASEYDEGAFTRVEVLTLTPEEGTARRCIHSPRIAECFPGVFGVRLHDDTMTPMFRAEEAVLVALGSGPKVGHAALCRLVDEADVRCRIWLGEDETSVQLGRLADGEVERVDRASVCWTLEVLYRLAPAA